MNNEKTVVFVADDSVATKHEMDILGSAQVLYFSRISGENALNADPASSDIKDAVTHLVLNTHAVAVVVDEFLLKRGKLSHSGSVSLVHEISLRFPNILIVVLVSSWVTKKSYDGFGVCIVNKSGGCGSFSKDLLNVLSVLSERIVADIM